MTNAEQSIRGPVVNKSRFRCNLLEAGAIPMAFLFIACILFLNIVRPQYRAYVCRKQLEAIYARMNGCGSEYEAKFPYVIIDVNQP